MHIHLRLLKIFNSQTEVYTEMKLMSIDYSHQVAEGFRCSWLQALSNQLIDRSLYIRCTNQKYYLPKTFLEYVDKSQVNMCIVEGESFCKTSSRSIVVLHRDEAGSNWPLVHTYN